MCFYNRKNRFYINFRPFYVFLWLIFVLIDVFLFLGVWFYNKCGCSVVDKSSICGWGGILFASFLATLGWLITCCVNIRNTIKQYTITTIMQSRLSATYMSHVDKLNKKFFNFNDPSSSFEIPEDFFKHEENAELVGSIIYILNYFEFISAALRCGDLDEFLLKNHFRGFFIRTYETSEKYIDELRSVRRSTLEHFSAVYNRWVE